MTNYVVQLANGEQYPQVFEYMTLAILFGILSGLEGWTVVQVSGVH